MLYHITAPAPELTSMSSTFLLSPTTTPQTDACGEYRVMCMYCIPYHPAPGVLPMYIYIILIFWQARRISVVVNAYICLPSSVKDDSTCMCFVYVAVVLVFTCAIGLAIIPYIIANSSHHAHVVLMELRQQCQLNRRAKCI